jgi:hypothetical protein
MPPRRLADFDAGVEYAADLAMSVLRSPIAGKN